MMLKTNTRHYCTLYSLCVFRRTSFTFPSSLKSNKRVYVSLLFSKHVTSQMMYQPDGFDDWMRDHVRIMNEMMRMQNAQIQVTF